MKYGNPRFNLIAEKWSQNLQDNFQSGRYTETMCTRSCSTTMTVSHGQT